MNVNHARNVMRRLLLFGVTAAAVVSCSVGASGVTPAFTVSLPGVWSQNIGTSSKGVAIICPGKQIELAWQLSGNNIVNTDIGKVDSEYLSCAANAANEPTKTCDP